MYSMSSVLKGNRVNKAVLKCIFGCTQPIAHLTLCDRLTSPKSAGINVICSSVFWLEVTVAEWQRAWFGPAHTCPWVFSAWCWWTSTRRVKGLSYKSGTITLEVKTCMMPLTGRNRGGEGEAKKKKRGSKEEQDKSIGVICTCMSEYISSHEEISK